MMCRMCKSTISFETGDADWQAVLEIVLEKRALGVQYSKEIITETPNRKSIEMERDVADITGYLS